MSKATLTAIQPPHTTNIFSGIKTIEWRTFAMPEGKHYVYETKRKGGSGMVIGTMHISRNYYFYDVDQIPEWLIREGCVSREFLLEYSKGKILYANVIYDAKKFDTPKPYTDYKRYIEYKYKKKGWVTYKYPKDRYEYKIENGKLKPIRIPADTIRMPPQSYLYIKDPEERSEE